MGVYLQLLGSPRVRIGHRWSSLSFDRSTTLLVYVAMRSDWVNRSELRGLFWPESTEAGAQSNLRQLLLRARSLPFAEPLEIETRRVRYFVQTDVEQFHRHLANAKWSDALSEYRGDFCSGCDQDGLDSADWLSKERERLRSESRQAALNLINEHEQVGDHLHAAEIARKLLEVDALDEEALMAFVRASAAAGHREEALEKYSRFEIMLREELGLEPMENVQQLIAAIRTGNDRHGVRQEHSLLEPRLVYASSVPTPGRVTEWQTLERAWDQQQVVFIAGEAGIGKTRLMLDFAATKGAYLHYKGYPGDMTIPFAAVIRHLRERLKLQPNLEFPAWIREALSGLLPELESIALPTDGPASRLRLFDALTQAALLATSDCSALLIDDVQYLDAESLELAAFGAAQAEHRLGSPLRLVLAFRPEEASTSLQTMVRRMVSTGEAIFLELGLLDQHGLREMLEELEWQATDSHLERLFHDTGGQPYFLAQVVQALRQRQFSASDQTVPTHAGFEQTVFDHGDLPLPEAVSKFVCARLECLSDPALQLVRLAALAGKAFRPWLAEVVLELEPLRMGALLEELEAAKLIEAHRFRADLIRRAILESMPTTTQALLFWRMAEAFERRETGSLQAAAFRHQAFRLPNGLSKSTRLFEDTAGRSALGKRFWNQPLDSLEPEPRNGYKTVS